MTPVELIVSKLSDAKKNGKGWHACCPAHEDRKASLSIAEGDDGRALVHCFAGCDPAAICGALNLQPGDLFAAPSTPSTVYGNSRKPERRRNSVDKPSPKPTGPTFATARDAIADLERRHGTRSALWTYHDAEGKPCGAIVRWDRPEGKDVRPAARIGDRWHLGGMPEPRPLYRLPEVMKAAIVFVCEGEKAADAVRNLSLTATTSAHGAKAAEKTDWTPLAGKQVVILPDNDEPGRDYADAVTAILRKLTPRPTVKIVELPGLPPKGDAVEWRAARLKDGRTGSLMVRDELMALADEAETIELERPAQPLRFAPFPLETLPEPIGPIVRRVAKALGCDPSFVVLPLLTALASAIGNTRRLRLKPGWDVPSILWSAIVAASGSVKSPAIDFARKPVQSRQKQALQRYQTEREVYELDMQEYERDRRDYQNGKRNEAPTRPSEPIADRYWCDDVTSEAVAARLQNQPRGLLLIRDELAGWFGGFDRYAGGKGGDAPKWLESFGGRESLVDRKIGEPIYIQRNSVCVTGSIQPAILRRNLSATHRENGLAARMLFAYPPRRTKRWTDEGIEPRDHATIGLIFDRLYDLAFATGDDGEPEPVVITLTGEAKALFVDYHDAHNRESTDLTDDLGAAWSKLEEYPARLGLVVHYARWAANDLELADESKLDAVSMTAGIEMARWFANEARRIYGMLEESDGDGEQRKLLEWIDRHGGRATPRELKQGHRRFKTTEDAELALAELVELGCGSWEPPTGQGGRPARRFVLSTQSHVYETNTKPEDNGRSVDVDTVDAPEESGEWGEV